MNSKENRTDLINSLGIGIFAYLLILKICTLIEFIIQNTLIIAEASYELISLIPKTISLITYTLILLWMITKFNHLTKLNTRRTLITLIIGFFAITILYGLLNDFVELLLMDKFPFEFSLYYENLRTNILSKNYTFYFPLLKYVILVLVFLIRKKSIVK
ncbi:hypothetical protein U8527_05580 [Kordia algicida OT-1]|uniref:Uncharacterized protein n=1 Tax=Kordia algicida OT-1 TaxID=391587 RepID=A9DMV4_9FLAO|nr:hypothetical protein [Kordia algicida]EDP97796.1 hypothetical protein KAOT1_21577 [Kordia algicida OT-1]